MGTRNLVCVVKDGEYKVAQYGQWDGYPEGQGIDALHFLREKMHRNILEKKLDEFVYWASEKELKAEWVECGADPDSEWVSLDVSDKHAKLYPHNSRDTGAGILEIVQNTEKRIGLVNSVSFAGDSLFCEWAWVVDMDNNTFEGYQGFNTNHPPEKEERFADLESSEGHDGTVYYPVRLVATFSLNDLPDDATFLAAFKDEEDD